MPTIDLKPGDIVTGLEPDEHVEIRRITTFGNKTLIVGIGIKSRCEIKRPLSEDEIAGLIKIRGADYTYDGDPESFLLGVEAQRIKIAYQFDPLFAVNSSVVDILPHQVEAVYRYLLPLPRIRFLLADDTGSGKTIMTGLLIKELLFRGVISKVLIITPGGLTKQWQEDEMRDKFGLNFRLINRTSFESDPTQFVRSDDGFFITSIDFIARHEGCLNAAKETQWDLVVVDEAHKLSAFEYGTKVERSDRYQAIEALTPRTDHLLFLTATPHRGRKDTFRRLLMLLDPDLFQKDELVTKRIHEAVATYSTQTESFDSESKISEARNRFFLRRLKEEIVDWDEQPLFKKRFTKTAGYELTPEELELYNAVTKYVRSRRKEAKAKRNRNVELTLMVMQRRLASSIYAITCTLQNRLNAINEVLEILRDPRRTPVEKKKLLHGNGEDIPSNIAEYDELDGQQRDEIDKRIFRQVLSDDPNEVEKERDELKELLELAESLRNHNEAKFSELLSVLDSNDIIRKDDEKLIIFTEYKDTLKKLAERLADKGYIVTTIDGSMDVDRRKQSQQDFRNRAKIMVATDAAGEGINLQFCRYLINWDIPWNPNRLEQRMGRIHRYGQKDDVHVFNLVATNTREGSVLNKVLTKLDVMRDQMGQDRVYDVIDELLEGIPLLDLLERSIDEDNSSSLEIETDKYLGDDLNDRAEELINLQKKQSLSSHLDLREARKLRDDSDENRLQPCFIQRYFTKAYHTAGGTIIEDKYFPVFHIGIVPSEILETARQTRLSISGKYDTPFVFDKKLVSVASRTPVPEHTKLLGPGHPLFDALIEWSIGRARDAFTKGVKVVDPNIAQSQRIWLVHSSIEDGRREEKKRLAHEQLSVIVADHLGLRATSPASLLSYTTPEPNTDEYDPPDKPKDDIQMWTYENLTEKQLSKVKEHRQIECELRRNYLTTTFSDLIFELEEKLNDMCNAQLFGETDPDEIQKLRQRKKQLEERRSQRLTELDMMLRLSANLPDIVTSALVIPVPIATIEPDDSYRNGFPMRRDDEVEQIAMEITMRYEISRSWTPADVSKDGEHYDIRSKSLSGEIRYIEVKGRSESGAIVLTGPEIDKLSQLGERAFLYIVTFCKTDRPRLRIIQNPMTHLNPEQLYRQVQYLVKEDNWLSHGEEVSI